jgi:hypothetical protein
MEVATESVTGTGELLSACFIFPAVSAGRVQVCPQVGLKTLNALSFSTSSRFTQTFRKISLGQMGHGASSSTTCLIDVLTPMAKASSW